MRLGSAVGSARNAVLRPFVNAWDWWRGMPDEGQVGLIGLLLVGAGGALIWPPVGLLAPGVALTAISMGFQFKERAVSVVLVAVAGLAVVAAIVVGGMS